MLKYLQINKSIASFLVPNFISNLSNHSDLSSEFAMNYIYEDYIELVEQQFDLSKDALRWALLMIGGSLGSLEFSIKNYTLNFGCDPELYYKLREIVDRELPKCREGYAGEPIDLKKIEGFGSHHRRTVSANPPIAKRFFIRELCPYYLKYENLQAVQEFCGIDEIGSQLEHLKEGLLKLESSSTLKNDEESVQVYWELRRITDRELQKCGTCTGEPINLPTVRVSDELIRDMKFYSDSWDSFGDKDRIEIQEGDECAICLDTLFTGTLARTRCSHTFHRYCLKRAMLLRDHDENYVTTRVSCPLCRTFSSLDELKIARQDEVIKS